MSHPQDDSLASQSNPGQQASPPRRPACPVCGGQLVEARAKLQCSRCHRICETCCEGDRG